MKKIGILCAMAKELQLFTEDWQNLTEQQYQCNHFFIGEVNHNQIIATTSGIGKVNAALTTAHLIDCYQPDMVINIGISGGLSSDLNLGEFVLGENLCYHDVWCDNLYGQIPDFPLFYQSDPQLLDLLPQYRRGLLCCGDKFIASNEEKTSILQHFPQCLAVDMESTAIAQVCYIYKTPLLAIRQISDIPGHSLQEEQYWSFWENTPRNSSNLLKKIMEKL